MQTIRITAHTIRPTQVNYIEKIAELQGLFIDSLQKNIRSYRRTVALQ